MINALRLVLTFNNGMKGEGQAKVTSTIRVWGPMNRYMLNEDGISDQAAFVTTQNAKELSNQVCLDISRFFFENAISCTW